MKARAWTLLLANVAVAVGLGSAGCAHYSENKQAWSFCNAQAQIPGQASGTTAGGSGGVASGKDSRDKSEPTAKRADGGAGGVHVSSSVSSGPAASATPTQTVVIQTGAEIPLVPVDQHPAPGSLRRLLSPGSGQDPSASGPAYSPAQPPCEVAPAGPPMKKAQESAAAGE